MGFRNVLYLSVVFVPVLVACLYMSVFMVDEGYVGVAYRYRALSNKIYEPGLNFVVPWFTETHQVQVSEQTDFVRNIPCGTSDNAFATFNKIEVVNQLNKSHVYETVKAYTVDYDKPLIFEKIHQEISEFCSENTIYNVSIGKFGELNEYLMDKLQRSLNSSVHTQGVTIKTIRLSKPINSDIKSEAILEKHITHNKALLDIEAERKTSLAKIESERQQAMMKFQSEQAYKLAQIDSEKVLEFAQIEATKEKKLANLAMESQINEKTIEKDLVLKNGMLTIQLVENEIFTKKQTAEIELVHMKNMNNAKSTKELYTKEFVAVEVARSYGSNHKIYYGNKLPQLPHILGFYHNHFLNQTF
jgi:erlin